MNTNAVANAAATNTQDALAFARSVMQREGEAILSMAQRVDGRLTSAVNTILACRGNVIVTGIGKAGLIGQKLVATFASTGTPSHFLHPAEAFHGDLGRLQPHDVVLAMSFSGETEEVVRLLPTIREMNLTLIAMTGNPQSALGRATTLILDIGGLSEACNLGLAPSTSTTVMLALGDALALTVSRCKQFTDNDFARYHPGGSLGRKLARVEEQMRPLADCRVTHEDQTVREVFVAASRPGRRTGAIMLTNNDGELTGIFTDSDLARLLESTRDQDFDAPIHTLMTKRPTTVREGVLVRDALQLLIERKISELPVVDGANRPLGLIDITDVVGLLPREQLRADDSAADGTLDPAIVPFRKPSS